MPDFGLSSEVTGTSSGTSNGSTTVFNIPHNLGTTPSVAFIQCSTHSNVFTYTYNATNIVVTFTVAPSASPSTITFQYRVVA